MTTITVAIKDGYAAIAADTLTKWGSTKLRDRHKCNTSKLLCVGDSVLGIVGFGGWTLVLQEYFESLDEVPVLDSQRAIYAMLRHMHAKLKDDHFLNTECDDDDEFESTNLTCGIANPHGIFCITPMRGVIEFSRFGAHGSGCDYALGAMHAVYDTACSAEEIVRVGVECAAEFDDGTAMPLESCALPMRVADPERLRV